jgi:hypothetical protein
MPTPRYIQMLSKPGFTALFWDELKQQQHANPKITHAEVYELLEKEYQQATGQRRYANFSSFLRRRDK